MLLFSPLETGTYTTPVEMTLSHPDTGAVIYYSVDNTPDKDSPVYSDGSPIQFSDTGDGYSSYVSAFAVEDGKAASAVVTVNLNIIPPPPNNVLLVDVNSIAGGNGRTWETAINDLQSAINDPDTGGIYTEIWVREGTYVPKDIPNGGDAGDTRDVHFALNSGLSVLGGFSGSEWMSGQRDPRNNVTILSGDLNGDDSASEYGASYAINGNGENAYTVIRVTNSPVLTGAVLDGFMITGGNADGGIYSQGGGMFIDETGSGLDGLLVTNCVFSANQASASGGAVSMNDNTYVTFVNVIFAGNKSTTVRGGGVYLDTATATGNFMNTVFVGNWAGDQGGGILWQGAGGAMSHCTLIGNHAVNYGQGMVSNNGSQTISSIIAWNNNTGTGTDIANGGPLLTIDNSLIETDSCYSGSGNINLNNTPDADPLFLDISSPAGDDGIWFTNDDGYLIQPGSSAEGLGTSPTLQDLYDLDDDGNTAEPYPFDILYQQREVGISDAGVHELQ